MSDERSASPAGADDRAATDEGDGLEPSGGPQRVVSDESVDDILESLESAKSESADSNASSATESASATTEVDEGDIPVDAASSAETRTTPSADVSDDTATEADDHEDDDGSKPDEATAIDAAASSLPDDASVGELAARVEEGAVTGADVRAAEAGEGRESTPEIDDVDLSMDDLETTPTGGSDEGNDWPDDAGPLAGSVDRGVDTDGDDGDNGDSPGLLGRLTRFFSR